MRMLTNSLVCVHNTIARLSSQLMLNVGLTYTQVSQWIGRTCAAVANAGVRMRNAFTAGLRNTYRKLVNCLAHLSANVWAVSISRRPSIPAAVDAVMGRDDEKAVHIRSESIAPAMVEHSRRLSMSGGNPALAKSSIRSPGSNSSAPSSTTSPSTSYIHINIMWRSLVELVSVSFSMLSTLVNGFLHKLFEFVVNFIFIYALGAFGLVAYTVMTFMRVALYCTLACGTLAIIMCIDIQ